MPGRQGRAGGGPGRVKLGCGGRGWGLWARESRRSAISRLLRLLQLIALRGPGSRRSLAATLSSRPPAVPARYRPRRRGDRRRGSGADGGHLGSCGGGTGRKAALLLRRRSAARAGLRRPALRVNARLGLGPAQRQCRRPAGVSDLVLHLDHRRLPRPASLAAAVLQWTDSAIRPARATGSLADCTIVQSNLRLIGLIRFDLSDSDRFGF